MTDTFLFTLNAILPIILLILLGYVLKRKNFLKEDWFKKANRLVFNVFLPVLLFINVYQIESFASIDWSVVLYAETAILAVFLLGLAIVRLTVTEDLQKGVILQCVVRSNFAIIGLPLAQSLGGDAAKGIAAVLSAFSIPTFNILSVIALTMYRRESGGSRGALPGALRKIVQNPLIIGVFCGLIALGVRSALPVGDDGAPVFTLSGTLPFFYSALENIAAACSPLALIILGGLFDFSAVKGMKKQIAVGTASRLVLVPALTIGGAVLLSAHTDFLNFDTSVYPALVALFASPVAVASAVMAQAMDNDGVLAGQLVVWTSVLSIFSLFFLIVLLRSTGLL